MSFPQHRTYKESGVPWLGSIPAHWSMHRVRWLCEIRKRIVGELGFDVLSITQHGIRLKDISTNDGQLSMDYSKYQLVEPGDFAMNHMDLLTGFVDISPFRGVTSPDYRVFTLRDTNTANSRYLLYLFQNGYLNRIFYAYGQGSSQLGRWRMPTEQFNDLLFPLPPLSEQVAVAAFLDRETAKIDALVEEQKRLIELLKEKRQAVISQAVTKGLDPNVPMKESGVEWLGKVPAHWDLTRVKRCCVTTSGGTPNTDQRELYYTDETGIPWVRTMDLRNDVLTSVDVYITEQALQDTACAILPPGTVMVAMYGGDGTVGKNGLLGIPAAINQAVCGLLPAARVVPEFMFRYVQYYRPFWMVGAESSRKDPNISQELVRNAPVVLPPMHEQLAIVEFLRSQADRFDTLSAAAQQAVALLSERRSALISAAVTGRIDVRGLLPQPEAIPA